MARDHQPGRCKFFNGLLNESCGAGVVYAQLPGSVDGRLPAPLPCVDTVRADEDVFCDKKQEPTQEDLDAEDRELEALSAKMQKIYAGTASWRKKWKGRSHTEVVECPACGGRLRLSIASINGHVHGRCEGACGITWHE
jgi:hypothetical protein